MRVTVDIATLDPEVLHRALKAMSLGFNEVAGGFHLVEGGVSIDVTAGFVTADTEAGRPLVGSIHQHYAEQSSSSRLSDRASPSWLASAAGTGTS